MTDHELMEQALYVIQNHCDVSVDEWIAVKAALIKRLAQPEQGPTVKESLMVDAYCKAWEQSFTADNPHHTVKMTAEDRKHIAAGLKAALADHTEQHLEMVEQPAQQPVSNPDELPEGFVLLQKANGKPVYAACMDSNARHYKWLMWKHPDGQWVSKRKLENWEVMQVEDQEHYGVVQEASHGIN